MNHHTSDSPTLPSRTVATPAGPAPISPDQEARAFWRMRRQIVRTLVAQTFAQGRLRISTIVFLSMFLWFALYALFYDGFRFLDSAIPGPDLYDQIARMVFGLFFASLMVMLLFSTAIILYSSLFRARNVPFLLTIPARAERVFIVKFQEAVLTSSWAFILLSSPVLLAYGLVRHAPWYYFAMLLPFLVSFTFIPAGIGAILCLAIVHRLPHAKAYVLVITAACALATAVAMLWIISHRPATTMLSADWFRDMLRRLQFTENRLLPSWWLSTGLLEAARGEIADSILFLVLMVSNALFIRLLAVWASARLYRSAYSRLYGRRSARRRTKTAWIDRAAAWAAGFLPAQVQLLIVKDLRLFLRDPVYWSQTLIFVGFLLLYFFSIPSIHYEVAQESWVNLVSFLNVSVVGFLLSTFTTRFVFPMISLEGRRFWILGLLPVHRDRILWGKFAFGIGFSVVSSCVLVLVSDSMLRVAPGSFWAINSPA